ncbi:MAG TPA: bile acid:sodium symporter [Sphingopyxis sp.]|nr:bile acid:sodium symporter [Sphingopyxis sp.]HMP43839.1 bile acid:sodium symporter [Sphingopyxis sp.]HMQ18328.1 bile acid:sodium symporter [Sphingopyxis sp.]
MTQILLPLGLFLIMFGMGLALRWDDFTRVFQMPRPFVVGTASILLLIPGVGFAVAAAFGLQGELAVGLILVAACPGGMFSNLMTDYAKGNVALSITLTAIVSMVAVLTIPFWAGLALEQYLADNTEIRLPFLDTVVPLVLFVLLPVALGMLAAAKATRWADRFGPAVKNVAALLVLTMMIYIAATQKSETVAELPVLIAAVVTLNLLSIAIAVIVSLLTRLQRQDVISVIMEHAVRQEGTGIYIAATLIGSSTMALPLLLNSGVGMTAAVVVVALNRRRQRREAAA